MKKYLFCSPRMLLLGVLASLSVTGTAQGATSSINSSQCSEGSFSQPFLSLKDSKYYTLAPGQSESGFNGSGWTLSGGAKIVTTKLPNGSTGTVLDLPSGSKAVSPVICVTKEYPVARAYVDDVVGSEGVFFYVSYEGTNTWTKPKNTGQIHGRDGAWEAVTPVNLQPENTSGWQPMRVTLEPGGKTSDFQVYDLYLDPRFGH